MKTITIEIPDDCEVKVVKKEEKKEPVIRTYQDLIDNKIICKGYYVNNFGIIKTFTDHMSFSNEERSTASSKKVAKSMLTMAMISQLMPYYGGAITDKEWNEVHMKKYVIYNDKGNIWTTYTYTFCHYLAFHTPEQRDNFLKYNEQLVKDYLMID